MMKLVPTMKFTDFVGIDNVGDNTAPKEEGATFLSAVNVDLDDSRIVKRRKGYVKKISSSTIHSLWGGNNGCFYVDGSDLKALSASLSPTTILSGLNAGLAMAYADVNDSVYFSNSQVIGKYVNGTASLLSSPSDQYKSKLRPGERLEFYNGRLFSIRDRFVFFSDAMYFDRMDTRKNFLMFPERVTMFRAVNDGIYVSAGKAFFLMGTDPSNFVAKELSDYPAIEGTDVVENANRVNPQASGIVVIWATKHGICAGFPGGTFINLTEKRYTLPQSIDGHAVVRPLEGFHQYLTVVRIESSPVVDAAGSPFSATASMTAEL